MEQDWARLGRALREARNVAGLTQIEMAERIGVTRTTVQSIEAGAAVKKPTGAMRAYAHFVGWPVGAVETVLAGRDPFTTAGGDTGDFGLPLRITEEISSGALLDTMVLDLSAYGSAARVVLVVRSDPGADAGVVREDVLAWRTAQQRLRECLASGEMPG
jgi:DNA-binding XRE family transcriptional regulator